MSGADFLEQQARQRYNETLGRGYTVHPGDRVNLPIDASQLITATRVFVQTFHSAINLADAADNYAQWSFKLPVGWAGLTCTLRVRWAPSTTNTGDCLITTGFYRQADGVTLSSSATTASNAATAANGTADRPQLETRTHSLSGYADGDSVVVQVGRAGANILDTFTGAARLLAVELSVAS